jgi:hypothetical protein
MANRLILATLIASAFVALGVSPAQAQTHVGKKISTVSANNSGVAPNVGYTDFLTVAVPTSYKSKSTVLKVTTSYLASCAAGDALFSHVEVGGISITDGTDAVECGASQTQRVTKVYFLPKEDDGGTVVAPGANVVARLSSSAGTGCGALHGVMTVEVAK